MMATEIQHVPVLQGPVSDFFKSLPTTGWVLDGTVGLGGHSHDLLAGHPGVTLLAMDRDPEALERAKDKLAPFGERVHFAQDNFKNFSRHLPGEVTLVGALVDLGTSMLQMKSGRGFSFEDDNLDMRMGPDAPMTAAQVLATYSEQDLTRVFREYGEEPKAKKLAKAIVHDREEKTFEDAAEFAEMVKRVLAYHGPSRVHPATRVFQALRIEVNAELNGLGNFLDQLVKRLAPGGICQVISFHSLEDRIAKLMFKNLAKGCICPPQMPVCGCGRKPLVEILTSKPVVPDEEELDANPPSRSARLRVVRRLP